MRIKIMYLCLLSGLSILPACSADSNTEKEKIIIKESDIVEKTIGVNGMTCVGCEVTLEENISKINGVVSVKASASENNAVIKFDHTKTDVVSIMKIVEEAGYESFDKAD